MIVRAALGIFRRAMWNISYRTEGLSGLADSKQQVHRYQFCGIDVGTMSHSVNFWLFTQCSNTHELGDIMPKKITLSDLRDMMRNLDIADEEIAKYLEEDVTAPTAFSPSIRINTKIVDDEGLEADVAMRAFNAWAKRRRQRKYRKKVEKGWTGLRIVSEGDSWFQYPFILKDVIDHLFDEYAIFSLGAAGDLVSDMLDQDEILGAIRSEKPHVFLISGGGNDLLGDGRVKTALHPFKAGRLANDYPNSKFAARLKEVLGAYRTIFKQITAEFPALKILCNGYDYAQPANGNWLGKPMDDLGIKDKKLRVDIVQVMIDRFNQGLVDLSKEFPGQVFRVNTVGSVNKDQWRDELHPNRVGCSNVADKFRDLIGHLFGPTDEFEHMAKPALSPGKEAMISDAKDLEPDAFRQLVDYRARTLLDFEIDPTTNEDERRKFETDISNHFEKISGGADFLPASFLENGAHAAGAVCRINLAGGFGSGFLVATRNFIMTNNHVIGSIDEAKTATAEFQFQDGAEMITTPLEPYRFFTTSKELDFTIVGCNSAGLEGIQPIPLLRSPATVTRGEKVNIVQHPRGRQKEVALHNNDVMRIKDKVVWYSTDTEPGSSGSPVFNNSWDLVALHHAGWVESGRTTNEGIRIAAIVSHLIAQQNSEDTSSPALLELLRTIPDSSPHLGFFDIAGIAGTGNNEVEVPEFRGAQEFADIGFWNIEHFNDGITDERVDRVAEVIGHLSLDAFGLIEVQGTAMERLKTALQRLGYAYDFAYLDVRGRQDLAVLYDMNTTELTLSKAIMDRHRTAWSAETGTGRSAFPRRPLIAKVKIAPKTDRKKKRQYPVEFIMICAHLKAFGDPESKARRRLAATILAEVIEDIRATEKLPVILGGDLNDTLNSDVLSSLTEAPDLFTLTADDAQEGALSYIGNSHRSLIDHIVVSNDVSLSPISGDDAAIVRLDKSVQDFTRDISDHVPIVIRMVSRNKPLQVRK